jgi:hypothetical protein
VQDGWNPAPSAIFHFPESICSRSDTHSSKQITMNLLPLAEFDPRWLGLILPLITLVFVATIVVISNYFAHQKRKLWHETARLALEKGQPVPIAPSAIEEAVGQKPLNDRPRRGDVKVGLILLAVATGLFMSREDMGIPSTSYYVPGFIGIAFLVNALITYLTKPKASEKESSQRQLNT